MNNTVRSGKKRYARRIFLSFFIFFNFAKKTNYSEQRNSSPFRPHTWECMDRLMWLMRISLLSNQLGVWHKEPLCLYLDLSLVWWVKKLPWPRVVFYLGKYKKILFFYLSVTCRHWAQLKFTLSEEATKIDKIFTIHLTVTTYCQIDGEDFVNICGLLRKIWTLPYRTI